MSLTGQQRVAMAGGTNDMALDPVGQPTDENCTIVPSPRLRSTGMTARETL
jgi:hypothetical protein